MLLEASHMTQNKIQVFTMLCKNLKDLTVSPTPSPTISFSLSLLHHPVSLLFLKKPHGFVLPVSSGWTTFSSHISASLPSSLGSKIA